MNVAQLSCPTLRREFTDEEWDEVTASVKQPEPGPIPELSDLESLPAVAAALATSNNACDRCMAFALLNTYNAYDQRLFNLDLAEGNYDQFWSGFFDNYINSNHLYIRRRDCESETIKWLRNLGRTLGKPIQRSPKFDGVIKSRNSNVEYGFLEVSKKNDARHGTKRLGDFLKLVNAMRAALVYCSRHVNWSDFVAFKVVGIQISGLTLQISRMSYGGGGVMLLSSSAAVTLPKEFDLEPTLQVLREVAIVQNVLGEKGVPLRFGQDDSKHPEIPFEEDEGISMEDTAGDRE